MINISQPLIRGKLNKSTFISQMLSNKIISYLCTYFKTIWTNCRPSPPTERSNRRWLEPSCTPSRRGRTTPGSLTFMLLPARLGLTVSPWRRACRHGRSGRGSWMRCISKAPRRGQMGAAGCRKHGGWAFSPI